jgi:galactose mutarotase-like enzyme
LDDTNGLRIEYTAHTDADTPIMFTNHAYFNLSGEVGGDHKLHAHIRACSKRVTSLITRS